AFAPRSHAEGDHCIISGIGIASHVEGLFSLANGAGAHAEGCYSRAIADATHCEGTGCVASSTGAHAEGGKCIASGPYSHAEGFNNLSSGEAAHSEGETCTASGFASHAQGNDNIVSGPYGHVEGNHNIVDIEGVHLMGIYGWSATGSTGTTGLPGNGGLYSWQLAGGITGPVARGDGISAIIRTAMFGTPQPVGEMICDHFTPLGADYAEYFEWEDGNPDNEERLGLFVQLSD